MPEPFNETGKWLLQSGCHNGSITGRDSGTTEHDSEAAAREEWARTEAFWKLMHSKVWFAKLVPPGARYQDAITLHPGVPYAG